MGCRGVHFPVEREVAAKLLEAAGDDGRLVEIVEAEIEQPWDTDHLCETDKAWDALHRCLSNGTLNVAEGEPPLNLCFFGGDVLTEEPDYYVVLLTPEDVERVATALEQITKDWLHGRYFSLPFPGYQGEKSEEDFEYTWEWFQRLPAFFANAAAEGRFVIFTVDQ